jgi:hypothetical protein
MKNRDFLSSVLIASGYVKNGQWYIGNDVMLKFNKKSITIQSGKGTTLWYLNPDTIDVLKLEEIIFKTM